MCECAHMQRSCQQNDTRFTNSAYMLLSFSKRNSFTIIFDPVENIMFQFRSHRWVVVERMLYIVPSSFSSIVDCCCAAYHILVENISFFSFFIFLFKPRCHFQLFPWRIGRPVNLWARLNNYSAVVTYRIQSNLINVLRVGVRRQRVYTSRTLSE